METVQPKDLYKQTPPSFGHDLLKYFPLDPSFLNLNHGSFGSAPYPVHTAGSLLFKELEARPDKFLRSTYLTYLTDVRERLAKFIGVKDKDELVLVPNASHGVNTVMRNLDWEAGDIIVCFNVTYHSVHRTAYSIGDAPPHPTVSEIKLAFPTAPCAILTQFKEHIRSLPRVAPSGKPNKRVVILDSIISNPGVLIPWKDMVKVCKEEGLISIVDAAHSIGQEQEIELDRVAPDFWVSNCHKWLFAKRSVAILYVPARNRHLIRTSIPSSHAYKPVEQRTAQDFIDMFNWNGTIDWIPFLTIGAALDFRQWIGGEAKIFNYCHNLALEGGKRMAEIMGTRVMDPNGELTLNMVNVELPLPGSIPFSLEANVLIQRKLLDDHNAYSAYFLHNGRWWTRCSAQVYNELEDFERLANIWLKICKEVSEELGTGEEHR